MTAVWAALLGLVGLVVLLLREAVKDMCRSEVQTRLSQIPEALIWLAVRLLPRELREDFGGEWRSEVDAIRREKSKTPLTGLFCGIFFATGLLIRARTTARAYQGRPQVLAMVWDAVHGLAIRHIPFIVRNRSARPSVGNFALAAPSGFGNGTISIRRPVVITVGLALTVATALTLYVIWPGQGLNPVLPNQGQLTSAAALAALLPSSDLASIDTNLTAKNVALPVAGSCKVHSMNRTVNVDREYVDSSVLILLEGIEIFKSAGDAHSSLVQDSQSPTCSFTSLLSFRNISSQLDGLCNEGFAIGVTSVNDLSATVSSYLGEVRCGRALVSFGLVSLLGSQFDNVNDLFTGMEVAQHRFQAISGYRS